MRRKGKGKAERIDKGVSVSYTLIQGVVGNNEKRRDFSSETY